MKKITAFLTAISAVLSLASCSSKGTSSIAIPDEGTSLQVQKLSDAYYKKQALSLPNDMKAAYICENIDSGKMILGADNASAAFWRCDSSLEKFEKLEFSEFDTTVSYSADILPDGSVTEFICDADYGVTPEPNVSSPDFNESDYDITYSFRIKKYSPEGKFVSDAEAESFNEQPGKYANVTGTYVCGDTVIASFLSGYYAFSSDGSFIGELLPEDGETIIGMGRSSSGELICAVSCKDEKIELRRVSAGCTLEKSSTAYTLPETPYKEMMTGTGDYSLFIMSMSTIYGVNSDGSSIEPIFSPSAAGISIMEIAGFVMTESGSFRILTSDLSSGGAKLYEFTPCSKAEHDNVAVLRIGTASSNTFTLKKIISDFNDSRSDVTAELVEYDSEDVSKRLLDGDIPDIFVTDINGSFGGLELMSKGYFCDLDDYFDSSELIPSIAQKLHTCGGGHLYTMPEGFIIDMSYSAKKKNCNITGEWNIDKLIDVLESPPNGMEFGGLTSGVTNGIDFPEDKRDRFGYIDWKSWIDFESGKCSFDTPTFRRFLEYCNKAPSIEKDYSSYNEMTELEKNEHTTRQMRRLLDDKALFFFGTVTNYIYYHRTVILISG